MSPPARSPVFASGPPSARLLPVVAQGEFLDAVAADLRAAPGLLDGPRTRGNQSYRVLTCARGWATLTTGHHLSKQEGGALARAAFPRHAKLIDTAFADRQSPDRGRLATPAALAESIEFADDLVVALGLRSVA